MHILIVLIDSSHNGCKKNSFTIKFTVRLSSCHFCAFKTGRGMSNCICSNGKIPFSISVGIVCTFERLLFYFVAWLLRLFSVFNVDFVFDYVLKSIKFLFVWIHCWHSQFSTQRSIFTYWILNFVMEFDACHTLWKKKNCMRTKFFSINFLLPIKSVKLCEKFQEAANTYVS